MKIEYYMICKCVRCPFSAICLFVVDKSLFDEFNVFCWITWEFMARFCADYNSCHLIGRLRVCCQKYIPLLQFEAAGERWDQNKRRWHCLVGIRTLSALKWLLEMRRILFLELIYQVLCFCSFSWVVGGFRRSCVCLVVVIFKSWLWNRIRLILFQPWDPLGFGCGRYNRSYFKR